MRNIAPILMVLSTLFTVSCEKTEVIDRVDLRDDIQKTLLLINKNETALILPKVPISISEKARLYPVSKALSNPYYVIKIANDIHDGAQEKTKVASYITNTLKRFDITAPSTKPPTAFVSSTNTIQPPQVINDDALNRFLKEIFQITASYKQSRAEIKKEEIAKIWEMLSKKITDDSLVENKRILDEGNFHTIGESFSPTKEIRFLADTLQVIDQFIGSDRNKHEPASWDSPYGKIVIAGKGNDTHKGNYFILIDLGGDDTYIENGLHDAYGTTSIVIDLGGNDTVEWNTAHGPGTGILGASYWLDLAGDDTYIGKNIGLGTGIFGTGVFIDYEGDDIYKGGSYTMGAGLYGIGVHVDLLGEDSYLSHYASQGYGGSGGIGMLIDDQGNDKYRCEKVLADHEVVRVKRHKDKHFTNMCQGYAFGIRPDYSGGIGLLLDANGNDQYESDIFAQGSAYWFGLGLLIDLSGNDAYVAYEHAQGEALHLAGGYLFDFSGDDTYTAHEHSQGTGIDRSIGLLIDYSGNDKYSAFTESQGSGIKPYGLGIMIDVAGNDFYKSSILSQGFSKPLDPRFPREEIPIGMLIDKNGEDVFYLEYVDTVNHMRIQNNFGISLDL